MIRNVFFKAHTQKKQNKKKPHTHTQKKLCKVSAMKCEQTRQKETKEVCTLLLKRSLHNLFPGITCINYKEATVGIITHFLICKDALSPPILD